MTTSHKQYCIKSRDNYFLTPNRCWSANPNSICMMDFQAALHEITEAQKWNPSAEIITIEIERVGKTTGRWQSYNLIVNGVDVGSVKRGMSAGGDRMTPTVRYDVWKISGTMCDSQGSAERQLIERAIRFGQLTI